MENLEIRKEVDRIREELQHNYETFVLDNSQELILEIQDLQNMCKHEREDGVYYFSLDEYSACPICDASRVKVEEDSDV